MVDQLGFSLGELLVLLDVDGVGPMSSPLPTPAEAAGLTGIPLRGLGACVELHGPLRFTAGIYDPPRTDLLVSPAHVVLAVTRFAHADTWQAMFDWITGFLADALAPTARGTRDGYREYEGRGVIASVAFTRPSVRLDAREAVIELGLRRAEPAITTVRRLLGLAEDTPIAPPADGNWREVATAWPLHLEKSRHGDTLRFRFSAPHHDGQTSTAGLVEAWCWRWLDLCAGSGIGAHDHRQVAWALPGLGHASIVRGDGAHRRDVHELHIPAAWLAS